jgi:hypothetical protein
VDRKDGTNETEEGIALLLEPTPALYDQETTGEEKRNLVFYSFSLCVEVQKVFMAIGVRAYCPQLEY